MTHRPPAWIAVRLFGIASTLSRDVDDWYMTREEAEQAVREIVADEPDLKGS